MLVNFCKKLLLGLQRLFFGLIRKRWNRGFDSIWLAFTSFGSSATALCIVLTSEPHIEVLAHFSYDQLATLHATYFVERFYSVLPSFRAHWDSLGVRARKRNHTSTRLVSNPLRYQVGCLRLVGSIESTYSSATHWTCSCSKYDCS